MKRSRQQHGQHGLRSVVLQRLWCCSWLASGRRPWQLWRGLAGPFRASKLCWAGKRSLYRYGLARAGRAFSGLEAVLGGQALSLQVWSGSGWQSVFGL